MILSANSSTHIKTGGKSYLYFGGTNYLSLAQRPELLKAANEAFATYGFSSGASRLTSGENELLLELEDNLKSFAEFEAAIVLPAGFMSNQVVAESIAGDCDAFISYRNAHASIKAAIAQTKKPVYYIDDFAPAKGASDLLYSPSTLRKHFSLSPKSVLAFFCESLDALTGNLNPIAELLALSKDGDLIVLDEAQTFGVLGKHGRGLLETLEMKGPNFEAQERLIVTGTFSKAIGTYGGFVLASKELAEKIRSESISYRGSTTLPPLICAASSESLRLIKNEAKSNLELLKQNIEFLNKVLFAAAFFDQAALTKSTPIYFLEGFKNPEAFRNSLEKAGIYIPSIRNYFKEMALPGLRWTIQARHSKEDLLRLAACLRKNQINQSSN